eukprot:gene13191-16829_t
MPTLKSAVLLGVGIANLPLAVVKDEIDDGRLVSLLPDWQPTEGARAVTVGAYLDRLSGAGV